MAAVLVTGGAGFIGSNLVIALVGKGYRVKVLDNFTTGRVDNLHTVLKDIELHKGDLRNFEQVRRAADGAQLVFHLGALPSVPRSVADPATTNEVNIGGTLNVFWASLNAGVQRVVYASSSSVYGDSAALPKEETMSPLPLSPYAVSKLAGEMYGRVFYNLYGLETVGLRFFNVYGPRQDPGSDYAAVIPRFITALIEGRPPVIYGDGLQARDFTYIDDVVQGIILSAAAPGAAGEIINIARGEAVSINKLLADLVKITGLRAQARYAAPRSGDVKNSLAGIAKAADVLGYASRYGVQEGLIRTVEWFRQRGE